MLAILLFCALGVIAYGIDTVIWNNVGVLSGFVGFMCAIYLIASIIPAISMMTRRMHDAGLSAWLWLVYIPSVAAYCPVGLIVSLLPTVVVGNKYHKNNK